MNLSSVAGSMTSVTREQFEKVRDHLLQRLQVELPACYTYHNAAHTAGVIRATDYLLQQENVPGEDKWMVLTAALFHDAGFLKGYDNHEELSCDVAWETLPAYGYSNDNIEVICRLIMVTKVPQTPSTIYEKIICDADLFYLGKAEFLTTAESLSKELKAMGQVQTEEEWQLRQLHFLNQHRYFTTTAKTELEPQKKAQIRQLRERIWPLK